MKVAPQLLSTKSSLFIKETFFRGLICEIEKFFSKQRRRLQQKLLTFDSLLSFSTLFLKTAGEDHQLRLFQQPSRLPIWCYVVYKSGFFCFRPIYLRYCLYGGRPTVEWTQKDFERDFQDDIRMPFWMIRCMSAYLTLSGNRHALRRKCWFKELLLILVYFDVIDGILGYCIFQPKIELSQIVFKRSCIIVDQKEENYTWIQGKMTISCLDIR